MKNVHSAIYIHVKNYFNLIQLPIQISHNLIDLSPYMNIMYLPNKYITRDLDEHKTIPEYGNTYI